MKPKDKEAILDMTKAIGLYTAAVAKLSDNGWSELCQHTTQNHLSMPLYSSVVQWGEALKKYHDSL